MDAAGARALARRIAEQQRRDSEAEDGLADAPEPPADTGEKRETGPSVIFTPFPSQQSPRPPKAPSSTMGTNVEIARARAAATPNSDVRIYSRERRREEVEGRTRTVTIVRCLALVEGEWQSRIVDVRVDEPD